MSEILKHGTLVTHNKYGSDIYMVVSYDGVRTGNILYKIRNEVNSTATHYILNVPRDSLSLVSLVSLVSKDCSIDVFIQLERMMVERNIL